MSTPTITVSFYRSVQRLPLHAYGLRVVVDSATDMPKEVFVFRQGATPAPGSGEDPADAFVCIADPLDLDEFPVGEADLETEIPYYRESEVTLYFRCAEDLEETMTHIKDDLVALVRTMKAVVDVDTYAPIETITI